MAMMRSSLPSASTRHTPVRPSQRAAALVRRLRNVVEPHQLARRSVEGRGGADSCAMHNRLPIFNGVFWLDDGGVRFDNRCRTSDGVTDCRHTMRRFFTLSLLIWSSGDTFVLALLAA